MVRFHCSFRSQIPKVVNFIFIFCIFYIFLFSNLVGVVEETNSETSVLLENLVQNMAFNFPMNRTRLNPNFNNWRERTSSAQTQTSFVAQNRTVETTQFEGPYFKPEAFDLDYVSKNLIVNYLPQAFTDKHLFDMFVPYGPLHSVKIMREPKSGYSYGFGFVNFIKVEDAAEALNAINGRRVGLNKRLKVAFARPPSDDIKNTNLYITNLPRTTTEEDIGEMFGKYGTIVQKNLLCDKRTGVSRGTAFVRYAHRGQAAQAIVGMNNFIPPGAWEPIRVKLAQDHGKQKAASLATLQETFQHRGQPPYYRFLGRNNYV